MCPETIIAARKPTAGSIKMPEKLPMTEADAQRLENLIAVAVQAPLGALPLSPAVGRRAATLGYAKVYDVRQALRPALVQDFGEAGADEIRRVLIESGLRSPTHDD